MVSTEPLSVRQKNPLQSLAIKTSAGISHRKKLDGGSVKNVVRLYFGSIKKVRISTFSLV